MSPENEARLKHGGGDPWYVDYCLTMQLPNFTPHGMYNEQGTPSRTISLRDTI
jgi:hypothetical protein